MKHDTVAEHMKFTGSITNLHEDVLVLLNVAESKLSVRQIAETLKLDVSLLIPIINALENQGRVSARAGGGWAPNPGDTMVELVKEKPASKCILIPRPGRCVVQREGFKAKSSIIIPGEAKRIPTIGVVLAVGDAEYEDLIGKRILFARMSGVPIYMSGHPQYDIFDYSELLAVVDTTDKIEFVPEGEIPLIQEED